MQGLLRWGNWGVAKIIEVLFNTSHLSDVGCTYRLLRREALERVRHRFSVGGEHFGPELMLLCLTSDLRIVEIPVNYLPRVGESSVTGDLQKAVRLGIRMVAFILRFRLRTLGRNPGRAAIRQVGRDALITTRISTNGALLHIDSRLPSPNSDGEPAGSAASLNA
jgi:hypothetical protein